MTAPTAQMDRSANQAARPLYFIAIVFLAVFAIVGISKLRAKEIIPWRTDFSAAQSEARSVNKPLLLYFTASWCGPCQTLKSTTWANRSVDAALRDYVPVKVDVDHNPALAARYRISPIPAMLIVTAEGDEQRRTEGYVDPKEFLAWLNPR